MGGSRLAACLATAIALVGCGATGATPSATPSAPRAGSTASSAGEPTPAPGTSAEPQGALAVVAQNIAFQPTTLSAPAGVAFVIRFDNRDAGVPHNLSIKDPSGQDILKSEIVPGPATILVNVPALETGSYSFMCEVHPNMTGAIDVGNV